MLYNQNLLDIQWFMTHEDILAYEAMKHSLEEKCIQRSQLMKNLCGDDVYAKIEPKTRQSSTQDTCKPKRIPTKKTGPKPQLNKKNAEVKPKRAYKRKQGIIHLFFSFVLIFNKVY